jgi:hypothetical protein
LSNWGPVRTQSIHWRYAMEGKSVEYDYAIIVKDDSSPSENPDIAVVEIPTVVCAWASPALLQAPMMSTIDPANESRLAKDNNKEDAS